MKKTHLQRTPQRIAREVGNEGGDNVPLLIKKIVIFDVYVLVRNNTERARLSSHNFIQLSHNSLVHGHNQGMGY